MPDVRTGQRPISFSYIVPVHNEAEDVDAAIASARRSARPHAPCEIVAVDDASTDGTRDILRRHAARGTIRLVERAEKRGAAVARNAGVDVATGDVVIFMDADNLVPPDFLERLWEHYEQGADFVTVESRVTNQERLVGRFQQATHQVAFDGLKNVTYSQSFSCRRDLALKVRFREELVGSEDNDFFDRLPIAESKWVRDPELVVGHRIPDTPSGLARQFAWRGKNSVVLRHVTHGTPLWLLTLRQVAVLLYWSVAVFAMVPAVVAAWSRARYSRRGVLDLPAFAALWAIQVVVRRVGEWRGLIWLWNQRRQS